MDVAEIVREPGIVPYRWTGERFMDAINKGLIRFPRSVELIDGVVVTEAWPLGSESAQERGIDPYRWSANEFLALLDADLIEEPHRVELLDGIMVVEMPPGDEHNFIDDALHLFFASVGAFSRGIMATPKIVLAGRDVYEPDYALFRPGVIGRFGPKRESDILLAIEVSLSSLHKDLNQKRDAYARAGIPEYWVFDVSRRGVWVFSRPEGGVYREEKFVPEDGQVKIPALDMVINLSGFFPVA